MLKQIPNLLTLLNLSCGSLAVVLALNGQWQIVLGLMLFAAILDFSDGSLARLLNARSELGRQLDSLADLISFGMVPALLAYLILEQHLPAPGIGGGTGRIPQWMVFVPLVVIPSLSALRMARFNLDRVCGQCFSGLPTPAHALFWAGIYAGYMKEGSLFGKELHFWCIFTLILIMAAHMLVPIPMYSLKFKNLRLRGNMVRYLLIILGIALVLIAGLPGLSLVILCYILLSMLNFMLRRWA